jgi:hypothetical protein
MSTTPYDFLRRCEPRFDSHTQILRDNQYRLSVPERDSLNHSLDSYGWDLARHIRSGGFYGIASADINRVTEKLFRLIDLALRRARQEEVVEYQTL